MPLDELLLGFSGRIGRGRFVLGLGAIVVVVAATSLIFRLGDGTFCRMQPGETLANVWLGALATMGAIVLAMLFAVCWKRMADIGGWRILAVPPVLFAAALPLVLRLEAFGPCGEMTAARAEALVWAGIGLAGSLSLHFLGTRREKAAKTTATPAGPAAQPVNE